MENRTDIYSTQEERLEVQGQPEPKPYPLQESQSAPTLAQEAETRGEPDIYLDGLEVYKDIVNKLRAKLIPLLEEGVMPENVANRIIDDFAYDAFKQSVKVNYR